MKISSPVSLTTLRWMWRTYKYSGKKKDKLIADEETVQKIITALENESLKYETYYTIVFAEHEVIFRQLTVFVSICLPDTLPLILFQQAFHLW